MRKRILAMYIGLACLAAGLLPGAADRMVMAEAPGAEPAVISVEAEYLGTADYGAPQTVKENIGLFRYRFLVDGDEWVLPIDSGEPDEEGRYAYPIQNCLKRGCRFVIEITDGKVTSAREISEEPAPETGEEQETAAESEEQETTAGSEEQETMSGSEEQEESGAPAGEQAPGMAFTPGERTLKNLLAAALAPAGTVLYIYGGGWDWQDEGSGPQAVSIGVSPDWKRFFAQQDAGFTYKDRDDNEALRDPASSYYPFGRFNEYYYAGLDCSGYLGWVIYNVMNTEDGKEGYVGRAKDFAAKLADYGWGRMEGRLVDEHGLLLRPGDIVSNRGHVWLVIGTCSDGSAVIAHSFQSMSRTGQPGGGVQLSALAWVEDCEAMHLARAYMEQECPQWFERYDVSLKSPEVYLNFDGYSGSGCFRWSLTGENGGLTDPDGFADLTAGEVLSVLTAGE